MQYFKVFIAYETLVRCKLGLARMSAVLIPTVVLQILVLITRRSFANGEVAESNAYYIRHYHGKCLEYDAIRQVLFFSGVCREKFQWHGETRLFHVPTKKCLTVNSTSDGSSLFLSNQCNGTDSIWHYDSINRVIKHLFSNKCWHPADGGPDPSVNTGVALKAGCNGTTNKYYFRKTAYFIIRHFGGLCWVYNSDGEIIRLEMSFACHRFEYVNDNRLRHVETGKCVIFSSLRLRLTDDCTLAQPIHLNADSLLQYGANKCVQPPRATLSPPTGSSLVLVDTCANEDSLRFSFYDDKDVLKVKLVSESCDEYPDGFDCVICKGHVYVNGHQYSPSTRGINAVIFDYRSGLFEHRKAFDVFEFLAARNGLADFLNTLPAGKILFLVAHDEVKLNTAVVEALQRVGVSSSFATTPVPKQRMSLAFIGYTGQQRKFWETSLNRLGGEGASIVEATISTFIDAAGMNDCSNELGLRTTKIPDSSFHAMSSWTSLMPYFGRLNSLTYGWCAGDGKSISEYLQVDLGAAKLVSGVAIQGHGGGYSNGITGFQIAYSTNGDSWNFYKSYQGTVKEFSGLISATIYALEKKVNWFQQIRARFLRIVPTSRITISSTNCMRIELFGCSLTRSFVDIEWSIGSTISIHDKYSGTISTSGTIKDNLTVAVSIAAENTSLATSMPQVHFTKANASTIFGNGEVLKDNATLVADTVRKINGAAHVEFEIKKENYYSFEVEFSGKVVDAGLPTGRRNSVITTESANEIVVFTQPLVIERRQPDRSVLQLDIASGDVQGFVDGNRVSLNCSISHLAGESNSVAYGVRSVIYFNAKFLQFKSLDFVQANRFSINASQFKTGPGFIAFETNTLWLLNNQQMLIVFEVDISEALLKPTTYIDDIIVDFSYRNNLEKFNGTFNATLQKVIPLRYFVGQARNVPKHSVNIPSPGFSMVFDDTNGQFFFCSQRNWTRSSTICYSQEIDSDSWKNIPFASAVIGVDVEKRIIYALDTAGKAYSKSSFPYKTFGYIEASEWMAIKSQPQLRLSLRSNLVATLPLSLSDSWTLSVGETPAYAVTARGILKHSSDGSWKSVVSWN